MRHSAHSTRPRPEELPTSHAEGRCMAEGRRALAKLAERRRPRGPLRRCRRGRPSMPSPLGAEPRGHVRMCTRGKGVADDDGDRAYRAARIESPVLRQRRQRSANHPASCGERQVSASPVRKVPSKAAPAATRFAARLHRPHATASGPPAPRNVPAAQVRARRASRGQSGAARLSRARGSAGGHAALWGGGLRRRRGATKNGAPGVVGRDCRAMNAPSDRGVSPSLPNRIGMHMTRIHGASEP